VRRGRGAALSFLIMELSVDRDSGEPAYLQLAAQIRAAIVSGELAGRVPSARSVSEESGTGMLTARRALRVLAEEGYVKVTNGLGTFTRPRGDWPGG